MGIGDIPLFKNIKRWSNEQVDLREIESKAYDEAKVRVDKEKRIEAEKEAVARGVLRAERGPAGYYGAKIGKTLGAATKSIKKVSDSPVGKGIGSWQQKKRKQFESGKFDNMFSNTFVIPEKQKQKPVKKHQRMKPPTGW